MAQQSAYVQGAAVCTHVAKLLLSFSIETLHGPQDMYRYTLTSLSTNDSRVTHLLCMHLGLHPHCINQHGKCHLKWRCRLVKQRQKQGWLSMLTSHKVLTLPAKCKCAAASLAVVVQRCLCTRGKQSVNQQKQANLLKYKADHTLC